MSTYQLYKKYKETSEIKKIYEQINDLRSLLENYNEYLPDSKEKLQEINTKAKELYQQYRNFNNLRMHIKQLLMFMSRHTEEFKEMQHDFFEIKQLLQQSQSGEAISMNVAVNTRFGNIAEKLLKTTDTRKRHIPIPSAHDSNKKPKAQGKTKKRERKKEPKKKKLETKKKIDFKKLRKHITQRLKPRFKSRFKFGRSKTRNKK